MQYLIQVFYCFTIIGISGVMDPVEPGLACGSDTAHMSIFGYDPFTLYRLIIIFNY